MKGHLQTFDEKIKINYDFIMYNTIFTFNCIFSWLWFFFLNEPVEVTGFKLNTYVSIKCIYAGGHSTAKLKEILKQCTQSL